MSEAAALKEKLVRDEAEFKSLQAYYEQQFAMFGTRGWKAMMEDVQYMHDTNNKVDNLATLEDLWFRKGELAMMQWMLARQDVVEKAHATLIAEHEGTEEEAPTGGVAKLVS